MATCMSFRLLLASSVLAVASAQCLPGNETCLPSWNATWDMYRSTVLYTCNNSGMHDVAHAIKFGVVVYDWSNAKAIWANMHPMDSEALITKQAEAVLAAEPGLPGGPPRVWAYRNTIKALNWYSSVREKLDDPKYASWFIRFKDYSGPGSNNSYHVPACDWAPPNPKCSGFYHDQEQTPEHPGGGAAYPVDGECVEQCDCGEANPCGEYIFDHRGGVVEGRTFRDWFIHEYMVTQETILHRNKQTGAPQPIGLGWLDDSMTLSGPTEEDTHYIADTGATPEEMAAQVEAYQESMQELIKAVIPQGGFWWQLMDGGGMKGLASMNQSACEFTLRQLCVPTPQTWTKMQMYNIPNGGTNVTAEEFTDYTAEFLLTRGPYAMLGYSWCGCTNGDQARPRAAEWDQDFGEPSTSTGSCSEISGGVFTREWTKATVKWDCAAGHGSILPK
eukprot:TRINITY_DN18350_c0_g1_i1.p2 TRINITY_DN18350_c0_g1~~TRINITY_DN18350_c0_g1_i1.p2  ORF type:complete len:446 (+),score=85.89 TRINITY_DN18350_c0_g1_i1:170-1507(+)